MKKQKINLKKKSKFKKIAKSYEKNQSHKFMTGKISSNRW